MLKYNARRPAIHHAHDEGAQLARLALIVNIGDAAFATILPLHLAQLAGGDEPVGYYFAIVAVAGIVISIASAAVFTRFRRIVVGMVSLAVSVVFLGLMMLPDSLVPLGLIDVPRSMAFVLFTVTLGLMVRDHATLENLAGQEGRFYLFSNLGWLIGPVLGGYTAGQFGNEMVFVLIAGIYAIGLLYLWSLHLTDHRALATPQRVESAWELLSLLIAFLRRPRLRRVFILALGLEVWWVVSSIYVPLAVIDLGFGPETVGWVVTAGIVPLVAMEAWVGASAQRNGIRRYLVAGFAVLALSCLAFPFLGFSPWLLLFMFAAVNIGAALIEPLTDTYFFEIATPEEENSFFGTYNASVPIGSFVGPLIGAAAFTMGFGFNGVWILTAVFLVAVGRSALSIAPEM